VQEADDLEFFWKELSKLTYRDPKLHPLQSRCQQMVLRERLIDPESTLIGRAQMGLDHILYKLGARVNARESRWRVLGAKAAGDYR